MKRKIKDEEILIKLKHFKKEIDKKYWKKKVKIRNEKIKSVK